MRLLPPTTSEIEAAWVAGAILGLLFTLVCLLVMARVALHVARLIQLRVLTWSGPRWSYAFGMTLAMSFFTPGWLAFLGVGLLASFLPPSPYIPDIISDAFGLTMLGGELCFAAGQATIFLVWYRVKAVTMTVPSWAPPEVRI